MAKYRVGVFGLKMGAGWARAVHANPATELSVVYDKYYAENASIDKPFFSGSGAVIAKTEQEIYTAGLDIVIVASPDPWHVEQSVKALKAGSHVICEKPLAPTVADCKKIIAAVKATGRFFMTGQVCRYAPGFIMAKKFVDEGRIGDIAFIESEYAHDYEHAQGYRGWRKDPKIKREGFIGGGCHAMDLIRWIVGDPVEVFGFTNKKLLPDWPTADTGVAVCKFGNGVIGKVFVSVGVKRPYTMRTVICGTGGTIVCDNTRPFIEVFENKFRSHTGTQFTQVPVNIANHNVAAEVAEFISYLDRKEQSPTDVYEGTRTVAFGEAVLRSAATGKAVKFADVYSR
ncbi:MAG: hypothetical protein A3K19_16730 [Lentisphaerae bacterium RIFOXYB12_FULL_65_16]|nr:MAG: hypothetical protein A3K18_26680 [Lentisphaerae bacterium RIFOXYA12_64_32]OGV88966.1 MAG: hypothetical protein A3K19_16730 [Lentisphaerae bacterium RIFOXYB12_FULL_65_16]